MGDELDGRRQIETVDQMNQCEAEDTDGVFRNKLGQRADQQSLMEV